MKLIQALMLVPLAATPVAVDLEGILTRSLKDPQAIDALAKLPPGELVASACELLQANLSATLGAQPHIPVGVLVEPLAKQIEKQSD